MLDDARIGAANFDGGHSGDHGWSAYGYGEVVGAGEALEIDVRAANVSPAGRQREKNYGQRCNPTAHLLSKF